MSQVKVFIESRLKALQKDIRNKCVRIDWVKVGYNFSPAHPENWVIMIQGSIHIWMPTVIKIWQKYRDMSPFFQQLMLTMPADEYSLIAVGLPIDILESAILETEIKYPRRGNTILVNDDFYIDILLKTSLLKESFDENIKYHARYTPEAKSLKDPDFVKKYYNELLRFYNILSDFVDEDAEFLENKLKKIFEETINII
jgi:hypothetical protein